jgi:hypothetical protein
LDRYVDQLDQADLRSDNEQSADNIIAPEVERFTAETLITAYYTVAKIDLKRTPILAGFR